MERNGDIVAFASYAPLLAKRGHTQWNPDLIYFNNTSVYPTISYEVQRLFGEHAGDRWLETRISTAPGTDLPKRFTVSTVRDTTSGDLIIKIVNGESTPAPLSLTGLPPAASAAQLFMLSAPDEYVAREDDRPDPIAQVQRALTISSGALAFDVPAFSLTVLRLPAQ